MASQKKSTTEVKKTAKQMRTTLRKVEELAGIADSAWRVAKQGEIARFFGVSVNTVQSWAKMDMPGTKGSWPLDKIAQWLRKQGPWRSRVANDDDSGIDSPALERGRLARAKLLEYELAERQEHILPVDVMREELLRLSTPLKRATDRLSQIFGPRAAEIIEDALTEFQRGIDERWAED